MFREQIAAAGSIQKLGDGLYTMEYNGDYGFDDFLEQGGADSDAAVGAYLTEFISHGFYRVEPETKEQGCSTIQAGNEETGYLFGRNFDWEECNVMVVSTRPTNGYASVSTCNLDYLGFGEDYLPEGFLNKMMAQAAIYVPLDGMNEKGLCVADLMIDVEENTNQDTGKPDLTTTTAIRLLLDKAATVEEAVALLKAYDMHSSEEMMHHLAIADCDGNSVVAEYVDNELVITNTKVVTNFFLTEGDHYNIGSEQSKERFAILSDALERESAWDEETMKAALMSVSQGNMGEEFEKTMWSIIYNQREGKLTYYFRENYDTEAFKNFM